MEVFDPIAAPLAGRHLIEASAGTGKTFTIATLYLRVLVERGLGVGEILVVTYTKAATAELRLRLRERLRQARDVLERGAAPPDPALAALIASWQAHGRGARARAALEGALAAFDEAAIHTIHAFCQRMLQELAFESGAAFDAELAADEILLRDEIVRDFWVRATHAAPDALLDRLGADKLGVDTLTALAARAGGDPALAIVPERSDAELPPLEDALAARGAARRAAALTWERERDAIVGLLRGQNDLKRNVYSARRIAAWIPSLDVYLAADADDDPRLPEAIAYLASTRLRTGTKRAGTPPVHPFFDACEALATCDEQLQALLGRHALLLKLDCVSWVRAERRRRRDASNTRSFDDLLYLLRSALAGPGGEELAAGVRARFPFAMVDECQDTDPQQHAIFARIYVAGAAGALYQIGDPKQAIFAFRGADVFSYLAAKEAAAGGARTLLVNWRSDPGLIAAVQAIFTRARVPFLLDEIAIHPVQAKPGAADVLGGSGSLAPLQILLLPDAASRTLGDAVAEVTRAIAAEIAATLASDLTIADRPVAAGDVAVLCRTNQQAIAVQDALRGLGVASVLQGDKSVFDTPEAAEVERLLAALANPGDAAAIRAALATTMLGAGGAELHRLRDDERAWDAQVTRFEAWHQLWTGERFMRAFRRALAECEVQPRLLRLAGGERRLTNVLHLAELLHRAETDDRLGPLQLVRWLALKRADATARGEYAGDAEQIRLESDADAVRVVTIHKSKGLEYAIAYCPFLWSAAALHRDDERFVRFHERDGERRLRLDVGSPEHDRHVALAEREALAEGLRLAYVALTRARHRCVLVWGTFKNAGRSPLAYLLHQPAAGGADPGALTAERFARLDDAALRRDLAALVAAAPAAIEVRNLASAAAALPPPPRAQPPPLDEARVPTRALARDWRVSSFTALTAIEPRAQRHAEEGRDHDAAEAPVPAPAPDPAPTVVLHAFPAGAAAGRLLHAVLERLDFCATDPDELRREVARALADHGFDAPATGAVASAIAAALETPLDGATPSLTLRRVARAHRLDEMQFVLPVTPGLTAARLAAVLVRHGAPARLPGYAERLGTLEFEALAGYLRGFVDLVFEHAGRWYVVDYKSNLLGPTPADYAPARLDQAMARHHYVLQYLLYTVAVHRHLAARLPGYDYARDFGGVLYLFLRGMAPHHPAGCGVYHDRPSPALIEELSALIGGTPP